MGEQARRSVAARLGWVLAPLLAVGCYTGGGDSVASAGADDDTGDDGCDGDGGTDGDGGSADDDGDDDGGSASCAPAASPLRRLTNSQYINTLEALFPGHELDELDAVLPADAALHGFKTAAETQMPSPALIEGYQRGALAVTELVFADVAATEATLATSIPSDRDAARQLGLDTIDEFGPRVFRRPLDDADRARYVALFDAAFEPESTVEDDFIVALSVTVEAMLQSPQFVYIFGLAEATDDGSGVAPLSDYELASRLSYLLWDTMPDETLLAAAAAGELSELDQLEAQARRMLDEAPAREALATFHRQWLHFDDLLGEMKDPATFPDWNDDVQASLHAQMSRFVEQVMFEGDATIGSLLTGAEAPLDATIAEFMGIPAPAKDWDSVALPGEGRRGVLTLPGFLAAQAHPVNPSPVLRGVFIRERLLCQPLPEPPDDIDPIPDTSGGGEPLTNRDRYEQHVLDPMCAGCHSSIDGLGFPFETFDAVGLARTLDAGQPIDASGEIVGTSDADGPVADVTEMIDRLSTSADVQRCVARQWFRYGFAREVTTDEGDSCALDILDNALVESGGDVREMLAAFVRTQAFTHRRLSE
ncbi:MAG: DUF1592 domain-containing protein [Myxococcota bacterium]